MYFIDCILLIKDFFQVFFKRKKRDKFLLHQLTLLSFENFIVRVLGFNYKDWEHSKASSSRLHDIFEFKKQTSWTIKIVLDISIINIFSFRLLSQLLFHFPHLIQKKLYKTYNFESLVLKWLSCIGKILKGSFEMELALKPWYNWAWDSHFQLNSNQKEREQVKSKRPTFNLKSIFDTPSKISK